MAVTTSLTTPASKATPRSGFGGASTAWPALCSSRIVGAGVARELCLTGRPMDAAAALRAGLVRRGTGSGLVSGFPEPGRLLDETLAMARTMIEAPQAALEGAKRYLTGSAGATFE